MLRALLFASSLLGYLVASSSLGASPLAASDAPLRWAYYIPEDPASLASLRQRAGDLDYVGLHWGTMRGDGSLDTKANPEVISLVRSLPARPILSVTAATVPIAHTLLATEASRASAVNTLALAVAEYDGISIDFEGLYAEDRTPLTLFMAELSARLRPAGKLVTMALSAKASDTRTGWAGALDYAALAPHADLFVLMTYGYRTSQSSVPGSVAPMSWVEACLSYAVSQIPPEKILLGVALYGYDWDTTAGPPARALRYPEALALATQHGATIQLDQTQQSARFSYTKDGRNHVVWLEDRASIEAKLTLVPRYRVAGVAGWRLGHEDPQVWPVIRAIAPSPTPAPSVTKPDDSKRIWYFAEGSTASPFDSWILLQNPNPTVANTTFTFMSEDGTATTRRYSLSPTSRFSLFLNQVVPNTALSTRVEADAPILAERAMYFRTDGHGSPGVNSPAKSWYLAEGSTAPPFDTWILVMNPNPTPATVTFTLMPEGATNRVVVRNIPPSSRYSLFANQLLSPTGFSARVEGNVPLIVERAMYFAGGGGHGSTGVTTPSKTWYLAEGDTNPGFDTWLLLMNPNDLPARATVTFAREDGVLENRTYLLNPHSRFSVFVNQVMPGVRLSMRVEADQPVIAERSIYFGQRGGHNTVAAPRLAQNWYLPEGSTANPFSEFVLIANPNSTASNITITWMLEGGRNSVQNLTIAPNARATIAANQVIPNAAVSARVESSTPVVVERSMYFAKGNGGTNTLGIPDLLP